MAPAEFHRERKGHLIPPGSIHSRIFIIFCISTWPSINESSSFDINPSTFSLDDKGALLNQDPSENKVIGCFDDQTEGQGQHGGCNGDTAADAVTDQASGCLCPAGSTLRDGTCVACTSCKKNEYEVESCRSNQDRSCVHAAYPGSFQESFSFLSDEGLRVEASQNVFVENLQNTRNMETTYYVTDRKQQTDFLWYRDSGIRINIGLQNINVIPVYEDVDHEGDNEFMLGRPPNTSEEREHFEEIFQKHCRNPIPDYYSITLEISRDRTTAAVDESCTLKNWKKGACSKSARPTGSSLLRGLNEPCGKMGSFPVYLQPATNSIVCTNGGALLKDLFNITETPVRTMSFPPEKCKMANSRCDHCLYDDQCQVTDELERSCCIIDCYIRSDCKQVTSSQCENSPVECATGDSYRYTLQPIFRTLKDREFRCHIRRRPPTTMYLVWFYVSLTGSNFETPRIYRQVDQTDSDRLQYDRRTFEFLTIEHSTGINPEEEFILVGKGWKDQDSNEHWNHTVHPLHADDQSGGKVRHFSSHAITPNLHEVAVQFSDPFSYSTSTWVDDSSGCFKDVGRFSPVTKNPVNFSNLLIVDKQTSTDRKNPYEYLLKSAENPPHMKFSIPANTSVLRWWFRDKNTSLIVDDSLKTSLRLNDNRTGWEIRISGGMSGCPGYLGVVINGRLSEEQLFNYDFLVMCPPTFNLTFFIAKLGDRGRTMIEETFDVRLDDSKSFHRVFLSSFRLNETIDECQSHAEQIPLPVGDDTLVLYLTIGFFLLLGIPLGLFISVNNEAHLKYSNVEVENKKKSKPETICTPNLVDVSKFLNISMQERGKKLKKPVVSLEDPSKKRTKKPNHTVIVIYVTVQFIFGSLLTFSTVFIGFTTVYNHHIETSQEIGEVKSKFQDLVGGFISSLEGHLDDEYSRQTRVVAEREAACDGYSLDLLQTIQTRMANETKFDRISETTQTDGSVTHHLQKRWHASRLEFQKEVDTYMRGYLQRIRDSLLKSATDYKKILRGNLGNPWFLYPRNLFNKTTRLPIMSDFGNETLSKDLDYFHLGTDNLAFTWFLDIHVVETVHLWQAHTWNSFYHQLTTLNSSVRNNNPEPSMCARPMEPNAFALEHKASKSFIRAPLKDPMASDSTKFFSSLPKDLVDSSDPKARTLRGNKERLANLASTSGTGKLDWDTISEYISWDCIKCVFVLMDIIISLFRMNQAYHNLSRIQDNITDKVLLTVDEESRPQSRVGDRVHSKSDEVIFRNGSLDSVCSRNSEENFTSIRMPTANGKDCKRVNKVYRQTSAIAEMNRSGRYSESRNDKKSFWWKTLSGRLRKNVRSSTSATVLFFQCFLERSPILPKTVLFCVLILSLNLAVKLASSLVNESVLFKFFEIHPFLDSMNFLVRDVNDDLRNAADYYTEGSLKWYGDQAIFDLAQLRGVYQFYFEDKRRRRQEYMSQLCYVKLCSSPANSNQSSSSNCSTCAVDADESDAWNFDEVLPCNFVPIKTIAYSVCNDTCLRMHLASNYVIIFSSFYHLAVALLNTCLLLLAVAAIAKAAETIALRCVRAKRPTDESPTRLVPALCLPPRQQITNIELRTMGDPKSPVLRPCVVVPSKHYKAASITDKRSPMMHDGLKSIVKYCSREQGTGTGTVVPGTGTVVPGTGTVVPGTGTVVPGTGTVASGSGTVAPDPKRNFSLSKIFAETKV